jgi:hypothetical protein
MPMCTNYHVRTEYPVPEPDACVDHSSKFNAVLTLKQPCQL